MIRSSNDRTDQLVVVLNCRDIQRLHQRNPFIVCSIHNWVALRKCRGRPTQESRYVASAFGAESQITKAVMAVNFAFRRNAVKTLTPQIGVYVLADLDNVPIYVGQSSDGIRQRVQRHLTSARSDIIANRQIDVWEIAWVWEFPVGDKSDMSPLEAKLFHHYDKQSPLMNGTIPAPPLPNTSIPQPAKTVQVMSDAEILERKSVELRLPRQAAHYALIVGHFLVVKNSNQIARAMNAHFQRLKKYHAAMLKLGTDVDD